MVRSACFYHYLPHIGTTVVDGCTMWRKWRQDNNKLCNIHVSYITCLSHVQCITKVLRLSHPSDLLALFGLGYSSAQLKMVTFYKTHLQDNLYINVEKRVHTFALPRIVLVGSWHVGSVRSTAGRVRVTDCSRCLYSFDFVVSPNVL